MKYNIYVFNICVYSLRILHIVQFFFAVALIAFWITLTSAFSGYRVFLKICKHKSLVIASVLNLVRFNPVLSFKGTNHCEALFLIVSSFFMYYGDAWKWFLLFCDLTAWCIKCFAVTSPSSNSLQPCLLPQALVFTQIVITRLYHRPRREEEFLKM